MATAPNPPYPRSPTSKALTGYWSLPVQNLVQVSNTFSDGMKERHQIYCRLVMALVAAYWNGNSRGRGGKYPWRRKQAGQQDTYLGHNIACIAVSGRGRVIAFDFNHNELFNSSLEHAEARLIRSVFSLASSYESEMLSLPRPHSGIPFIEKSIEIVDEIIEKMSDTNRKKKSYYATSLKDVTVYTSLESCAQCSGIMALGCVKEVVFLQMDPEQHCIGNILFNLMDKSRHPAPRPIPAGDIGLAEFARLNKKYVFFQNKMATKPFFEGKDGTKDCRGSITSFLCTDIARNIFIGGQKALTLMVCQYPTFKPHTSGLSNQEVLTHARIYLRYAESLGRRGTPHKA